MSLSSSPTSSISYLRGSSFFSALPFGIVDGLRYAKGSDYVAGLSHWWKHVDDVSLSVVSNSLLILNFYSLPVILASD
jgi:hypothetical protein